MRKNISKPLNSYAYIPRTSVHPGSAFSGLIVAEVFRIRRTCSFSEDFEREKTFFASKIFDSGFSSDDIINVFFRYPFSAKQTRDNSMADDDDHDRQVSRVSFFKFSCFLGVEKLHITATVCRHVASCVAHSERDRVKVVTAFTAGQNLFRRRYNRFWLKSRDAVRVISAREG